jgi:hypothetical protein
MLPNTFVNPEFSNIAATYSLEFGTSIEKEVHIEVCTIIQQYFNVP